MPHPGSNELKLNSAPRSAQNEAGDNVRAGRVRRICTLRPIPRTQYIVTHTDPETGADQVRSVGLTMKVTLKLSFDGKARAGIRV